MSNNTSKKDAVKCICDILGLTFPSSFENGSTVEKEFLIEMIEAINEHNLVDIEIPYSSEENKIPLAQHISDQLTLQWLEGGFDSTGSTIQGKYFVNICNWLKEHIAIPERIEELRYEIISKMENIYEKGYYFLGKSDLYFEVDDFVNFSENENWLKSLKPVWKCLHPGVSTKIDWSAESQKIRDTIISELFIQETSSRIEFLEAMNIHLSFAELHLNEYHDDIEENNLTKTGAKTVWTEKWDNLDDQKGNMLPIIATTSTWRIGRFVEQAKAGHLDLDPIYQRTDVWGTSAQRMLMNSIFMGIPLPSVILYETQEGNYQIIDGKQRITSILRFIGKLPKARDFMQKKMPEMKIVLTDQIVQMVGLTSLADVVLSGDDGFMEEGLSNKQVKRYKTWKNNKLYGLKSSEEKEFGKKYLPFSLGTTEFAETPSLSKLNGKFFHEIRDFEIQMLKKKESISTIFEGHSEYKIPIIIYDSNTKPQQIRRVFKRYNKTGQSLNATEVNNAAYQSIDAMKLTMAISRIRPERGETEILPGIYDTVVGPESIKMEEFFNACQINDRRFGWAKLFSLILSLLYLQPPRKKGGEVSYPGTGKFIESFFDSELNKNPKDRLIKKNSNCKELAEIIGASANSLSSETLWEILDGCHTWSSSKENGKWSEPALVSMMVASIICHSSGVNLEEKINDTDEDFSEYLETHEPLGQTQSNLQWQYYAQTVTDVCNIFGVSKDNYQDKHDLFSEYNLLEYFEQIIEAKKMEEVTE